VDELIGAGDEAMYTVKRGAKNGVHHFVARSPSLPLPDPSRDRRVVSAG
jgi:hypothetical protein